MLGGVDEKSSAMAGAWCCNECRLRARDSERRCTQQELDQFQFDLLSRLLPSDSIAPNATSVIRTARQQWAHQAKPRGKTRIQGPASLPRDRKFVWQMPWLRHRPCNSAEARRCRFAVQHAMADASRVQGQG